ncbi:TPA: hypothetical protein N0F65_012774 [Lagenidium giganteum]|uniref:Cytochrome b5 heme-binding domain-containing protein n=1 Tax=Lagenidium giganteum TaxID=4803 RepID=A0AAV2YGS4_9STRA|nr:TPA: hypothetical protein N0F65_012774 [Lagenidium giganteum]
MTMQMPLAAADGLGNGSENGGAATSSSNGNGEDATVELPTANKMAKLLQSVTSTASATAPASAARGADTSVSTAFMCLRAMGACYPTCMTDTHVDYQFADDVLVNQKERRRRSSVVEDAAEDKKDDNIVETAPEVDTLTEQLDVTLDLEEIGQNYAMEQAPSSIEVDYEDNGCATNALHLLDGSAKGDCSAAACKPLEIAAVASPNPAEDNNEAPVSASRQRRRSRTGSLTGNQQQPLSSRRGKTTIIQSTSVSVEDNRSVVQPASEDSSYKKAQTEEAEPGRCSTTRKLCLCEVQLHKSAESCWLVANKSVYDVTGLLSFHPAGLKSILRKAGGPDCTQDMKFHSKGARKLLEQCFIGKLQPCGDEGAGAADDRGLNASCTIM